MKPFKIYTKDKDILEKVAEKYGLRLMYKNDEKIAGYFSSYLGDLLSFENHSGVDILNHFIPLDPEDFMENSSPEEKREYLTEEDFKNDNFEVGKYYLNANSQLCKLDYFFKDKDEDYILIGEPVEHVGDFKGFNYATCCTPYKSREDALQEELECMIYRLTGINDEDIRRSLSRLFIDGKFDEVIAKVEDFKKEQV